MPFWAIKETLFSVYTDNVKAEMVWCSHYLINQLSEANRVYKHTSKFVTYRQVSSMAVTEESTPPERPNNFFIAHLLFYTLNGIVVIAPAVRAFHNCPSQSEL